MLQKLWTFPFEGSDYCYTGVQLGNIIFAKQKNHKIIFETDFGPLTQQSGFTSMTFFSNLIKLI